MTVMSAVPFYAGFWKRLAAVLIDWVFVAMPIFILTFQIGHRYALSTQDSDEVVFENLGRLAGIIGVWLYFAVLESSAKQGTLGKMALRVKVVDIDGRRISFARATGRHFAKIISGLILGIGFIMVAFTSKKQGLHDIMANCLVVRREPAA